MRYTLALLLLVSANTFAQTVDDYTAVAGKLIDAYNKNDPAAFDELFANREYPMPEGLLSEAIEEFGKVIAYQYMQIDSNDMDVHGRPMCYFKAICSKNYWDGPIQAMSISLDKHNKISGIRFFTKSSYTDKMLKKY